MIMVSSMAAGVSAEMTAVSDGTRVADATSAIAWATAPAP
jgi:hypothetical protein